MHKVFIDGGHGTTGLRIHEYLEARPDIEVLDIDPADRKNTDARLEMIRAADVSILCLPDQAAIEIAAAAPADSVLIDTSSAHRTAAGWTYGMPELTAGQRDLIRSSTRISNPGCHASGFILLVRPLIEAGILSSDALLTCFCMTGYSGGGKSMIANYEADGRMTDRSPGWRESHNCSQGAAHDPLCSPGQYALTQNHKHLPEMVKMTGLEKAPCFSPVVGDFYSGMVMTVPLHAEQLMLPSSLTNEHGTAGSAQVKGSGDIQDTAEYIKDIYRNHYAGEPLIHIMDGTPAGGFMYSSSMAGRNDMQIYVTGNSDRLLLAASYDNLGKGASGAAVQNLNIVLGAEETEGLI